MADVTSSWNSYYAAVPRPGRRPRSWPAVLALTAAVAATVVAFLAGLGVLPFWWKTLNLIMGGAAMAAASLLVLAVQQAVAFHRAHTWTYGEARLVQAVWSSPDEMDSYLLHTLMMPLDLLIPIIGPLVGMATNRSRFFAFWPEDGRARSVKVRARFDPPLNMRMTYVWTLQARVFPRTFYALGDLMPGGPMNQVFPDGAMSDLAAELYRVRKLNTPPRAESAASHGKRPILPGGPTQSRG